MGPAHRAGPGRQGDKEWVKDPAACIRECEHDQKKQRQKGAQPGKHQEHIRAPHNTNRSTSPESAGLLLLSSPSSYAILMPTTASDPGTKPKCGRGKPQHPKRYKKKNKKMKAK